MENQETSLPGINENKGPAIRAIAIFMFSLVALSGSLRMGTRIFLTRQFGWDDFTMALALVRRSIVKGTESHLPSDSFRC